MLYAFLKMSLPEQTAEKFYLLDTESSVCNYTVLAGTANWFSALLLDLVNRNIIVYETREPFGVEQNRLRLKTKADATCISATGMFPSHLDAFIYSSEIKMKIAGKIHLEEISSICKEYAEEKKLICWTNTQCLNEKTKQNWRIRQTIKSR